MATDGDGTYVPADANWRELARQVQREKDPEKMIHLVEQLIAKFDEEKRRVNPQLTRTSKPSGSLTSKPS